jgi:hypothetical protein
MYGQSWRLGEISPDSPTARKAAMQVLSFSRNTFCFWIL